MTRKYTENSISADGGQRSAWGTSYCLVRLLLAGVFGGFSWVAAGLHMHGVDDVEEVFHHRHSLQGRVHTGVAVHTLEEARRRTGSGKKSEVGTKPEPELNPIQCQILNQI